MQPDPSTLRSRLADATLMLVFTPELCTEPLAALAAAAPHVDVVQVRPKAPGERDALTDARAAHDWCRAVLAGVADMERAPLVLVNDRVDVARVLWPEGLAGVHVGQDDCPAEVAREVLGDGPLIGLSTHTSAEVALSIDQPVDYLGFGPVHATDTKGYAAGQGADRAWLAATAATVPLFPIGGIDATRAPELAQVGRAAVGSAILCAPDPAAAARELRAALAEDAY